jgi:NAD(P)-dependent dehydrogenase (short-subunit alcohol dehydrogenase family)
MNSKIKNVNSLVVGASRGIGLGFVKRLLQDEQSSKIYATYRCQESAAGLFALAHQHPDKVCCLKMDLTEEEQITQTAAQIQGEVGKLHLVINCVGILHEGTLQPEKNLRQIQPEHLLRYFQVNSIGSVLLAKHFLPLLRHQEKSVLAALSAKVGSIGDNQLGGWYGYRASKAALNMFLHTAAIEYRRTSPQTIGSFVMNIAISQRATGISE